MDLIDKRLEQQKQYPRAMQSYVMVLYEFVLERRPNKILEIGVCTGQSTKTILMALGKVGAGTLVSIDIKRRGDILDEDYSDLKKYWQLIRGDSSNPETVQAAKDALDDGEQYDMCFIDGAHKMPVVGLDVDNYFPMVAPGGIILMHDITNKNEEVDQAWEKITWPKFAINWGRARNNVTPGLGIVQRPLE